MSVVSFIGADLDYYDVTTEFAQFLFRPVPALKAGGVYMDLNTRGGVIIGKVIVHEKYQEIILSKFCFVFYTEYYTTEIRLMYFF